MINSKSNKIEDFVITHENVLSSDIEINDSGQLFLENMIITSGSHVPAYILLNLLAEEIGNFSKITSDVNYKMNVPNVFFEQVMASSQTGSSSFLETRFIDTKEIRKIALAAIKKLEDERAKYIERESENDEE